MKNFQIGHINAGHKGDFFIIAGPCVIESQSLCEQVAEFLVTLQKNTGVKCVFKASYDKANRTSIESFRGPGLEKGLKILDGIRAKTGLPILTDVHDASQAKAVGEVVDCLQIPAFLCRQTDLLVACGNTGKPVNIKKGQFLAPWDMEHVINKVTATGNNRLLLTDRGTMFGYNNLVADFRSIKIMQDLGWPVVFDATHSVQLPGGAGASSGGQRKFAPILARAGVASGADAVFLEVHSHPERALCDGPNSLSLDTLPGLLRQLKKIHHIVSETTQ